MILAYLGACRASLQAMRLVCKGATSEASRHLFTSVVIANRAKSICNARDIMRHPQHRKYVHTLVRDISTFPSISLEAFADLERGGQSTIEQDFSFHNNTLHEGGSPELEQLTTNHFQRYTMLANIEKELRKNGDVSEAVSEALVLPALRHVVCTDFRSFRKPARTVEAAPKESFRDLCKRLFGFSVAPQVVGDDGCDVLPQLRDMLDLAGQIGRCLESFECGENYYGDENWSHDWLGYVHPFYLDLDALAALSSAIALQNISKLRLSLGLREWDNNAVQSLKRLLVQSADNLKHLTLHVELDGSMSSPHRTDDSRWGSNPPGRNGFLGFFGITFGNISFQRLRFLDLGGIPFDQVSLGHFLCLHKDVLQFICLRSCFYNVGPEEGISRPQTQSSNSLFTLIAETTCLQGFYFRSVVSKEVSEERACESLALKGCRNRIRELID